MGTFEVLLILIIALIIWGPGKLPEVARALGKIMRDLRKATADLTASVTEELNIEEKKELQLQSGTKSNTKTEESPDKGTANSATPE